jgi:hypothetical protein
MTVASPKSTGGPCGFRVSRRQNGGEFEELAVKSSMLGIEEDVDDPAAGSSTPTAGSRRGSRVGKRLEVVRADDGVVILKWENGSLGGCRGGEGRAVRWERKEEQHEVSPSTYEPHVHTFWPRWKLVGYGAC